MHSKRTLNILKGLKKIFRVKDRWVKSHLFRRYSELNTSFSLTHPLQYNNEIVRYADRPVYQVCVVGGIGVVCNSLNGKTPTPYFEGFNDDIFNVAIAMGFYGDGTPYSEHNQLVNWNNDRNVSYEQFMERIEFAIKKAEGGY